MAFWYRGWRSCWWTEQSGREIRRIQAEQQSDQTDTGKVAEQTDKFKAAGSSKRKDTLVFSLISSNTAKLTDKLVLLTNVCGNNNPAMTEG